VWELASGRWMNQEGVGQKQMEKMLCKSLSWKTGNRSSGSLHKETQENGGVQRCKPVREKTARERFLRSWDEDKTTNF